MLVTAHHTAADAAGRLKVKFRVPPVPKWCEAEAPHLSDDERAKVWSLFEPLYRVADVPWGD